MISPPIDAPADSDIMPAPRRKTLVRKRTMTRLEEAKTELTLKFIAGRRPTNKEMIEVEKLREEISELEYEQRRDISWCKS
jgi:hypothetical protein